MIKKLFRLILSIVSHKFSKSGKGKLIVKLDAIGDFFILLNCLKLAQKQGVILDSELSIVCYEPLPELGQKYFPNINWIGVSKNDFSDSPNYRCELIKKINESGPFETTANFVFSRDFSSDDLMANIVTVKKYGYFGDRAKQGLVGQFLGSLIYNFKINKNYGSEFLNLMKIFELLSNKKLNLESSSLDHSRENYLVIFPGASWFGKAWQGEGFKEVIERILETTDVEILVCGGKEDLRFIEKLKPLFGERVKNLVGKTSLIELCDIIKKTKAILTNDTSAAHIAQFFSTPGVAIIGGGHSGRFLPYTKVDSLSILSKEMNCFGCHWNCEFDHGDGPVACISEISTDEVMRKLRNYL